MKYTCSDEEESLSYKRFIDLMFIFCFLSPPELGLIEVPLNGRILVCFRLKRFILVLFLSRSGKNLNSIFSYVL